MTYGATPQEWAHFDVWLGLTQDLLPVVADPAAQIADYSDMEELGKTPSRFDTSRRVCGMPKWTKRKSTGRKIQGWAREPDYGICLQTRSVRAIDCDTPDAAIASRVEAFIADRLDDKQLPRRGRSNSSKFLLAFELPGNYGKRRIRIEGENVIEFLATGQQFVAVGTHPSGVRYEWRGGLPWQIPELSADEFESLWTALAAEFGAPDTKNQPRRDAPKLPAGPHGLTLADLREMLVFVPGVDGVADPRWHWLQLIWALRSAWRESIGSQLCEDELLVLADEFSRRPDMGHYRNAADVRKHFSEGDGKTVSWRTLLWYAYRGGWRPTVEQQERLSAGVAAEFEDLTREE